MLFPTASFAAFLLCVLTAHTVLRRQRWAWTAGQLLASAVFLAWADWRLAPFTAALAGWTWVGARFAALARGAGRSAAALVVPVGGLVATLVATRYLLFALDAAAPAVGLLGADLAWRPSSWWVPLGVSFLTFQGIMVVVDTWRGQLEKVSLTECALLLGFFPKVAAGPLARPAEFVAQLRAPERPVYPLEAVVALGVAGLSKKVLVADTLYEWDMATATAIGSIGGIDAWFRLLVGPVRFYCDISAYSDLAIAAGMLVGIKLPANFHRPLAAASVSEFWRRWHVTVSEFFRDYVLVPLRGGRVRPGWRLSAALVATMWLSGLWHGATWGFALWGALNGAVLAAEAAWRVRQADRRLEARRRGERPLPRRTATGWRRGLGWAATFGFVALTSPLFSGAGVSATFRFYAALGHPLSATHLTWWVALLCAAALASQFTPRRWGVAAQRALAGAGWAGQAAFAAVAVTVIYGLSPGGLPPFLYLNF